jgi:outer membrane protein assembly factor BamA
VPGSLLPSDYVVRGYPVGEFIGSTLATGTFEYRFPISYPYGGPGTWPIFFNKLHGAVFADAVTLKGVWYENTNGTATVGAGTPRSTDLGTYFVSAGGELRSDLQIFYGIPLTIRAGYYYGFENRAFGGSGIFLGFGLAN